MINTIMLSFFVIGCIVVFWLSSLALYHLLYKTPCDHDRIRVSHRTQKFQYYKCLQCGEELRSKRLKNV